MSNNDQYIVFKMGFAKYLGEQGIIWEKVKIDRDNPGKVVFCYDMKHKETIEQKLEDFKKLTQCEGGPNYEQMRNKHTRYNKH